MTALDDDDEDYAGRDDLSNAYHLIVAARRAAVALQHMRAVLAQQLAAGRVQLLGRPIVLAVLQLAEEVFVAHPIPDAVAFVGGGGGGAV